MNRREVAAIPRWGLMNSPATCYLETRTTSDSPDILSWWKEQSKTFPRLRTLARQLFAIPASSAASERSFSVAGCTISARCTALSTENVENILFIHSNH
jgi:hypothetical protein